MKFARSCCCLIFLLLFSANCFAQNDKAIVVADAQYAKHGFLHQFLFGKNYRKIWNTPITVDSFYFKTNQFTPVKIGGGLQTVSLQIIDANNKEWVLRSVQKNPVKWLSPFLQKTFVRRFVQDQISASFPYGALIVPPMAEALQIAHASPQLVVVSNDIVLGKFQSTFANRLCFLEARNPKGKSISTEKLLHLKDSLSNIIIDSIGFLKCRLLDIVLGDWDRHPDQFKWYLDNSNGVKMYKPIPNDRDQVLFKSNGAVPKLILKLGFMKYLEGFDYEVKNIKGFMQRGAKLDKKILGRMTLSQIEVITNEIVHQLTNEVLQQALNNLPTALPIDQTNILNKLINRRDDLPALSKKYYRKVLKKANATIIN